MKTNVLKIQRKHPLLFDIFYDHLLRNRRMVRSITRLQKVLLQKADELYGWEDDRETYDACIIVNFGLEGLKKRYQNELD